jgi:pimeloyl-ACP methyl ester carboxylesterase
MGQLAVAQQTITVFGQQIAYYEAGQGRAVVLLSNLGCDSHAWSQNMLALAAHYRVLAIDVLGTGASSKPLVGYKMATPATQGTETITVPAESRAS